jgi:hypothetical protein
MVSIIVGLMSEFMRYQTRTEIVIQEFQSLFITSFIVYTLIPIIMNLNFYTMFIKLFIILGMTDVAKEWTQMQTSADIIEKIDNQWFQNVGGAIFSAMVVEILMPQILVLINVIIQAIQDIPK